MMRANSSLRAREQLGGPEQDLLALVARQLRLEGLRRWRRPRAHARAAPPAPCRPPRRCRDRAPRSTPSVVDLLAGDAHRLVADRCGVCAAIVHGSLLRPATRLQRDVEDVEIAQLVPGRNRRPSRLTMNGTTCSVSPPCERSGSVEPGEIVLLARWCRAPCARSRSPRCRRCGRPAARSARRPPSRSIASSMPSTARSLRHAARPRRRPPAGRSVANEPSAP